MNRKFRRMGGVKREVYDLGSGRACPYYQNGRKTPSFSYGDISPLSVKSSMDIDRKKFTLSIELDKHIQYNLNHEI